MSSFGSDASPLKLKVEFYKEAFLMSKLVAEAALVLADFADGEEHEITLQLFNKRKRTGSANMNMKISVGILLTITDSQDRYSQSPYGARDRRMLSFVEGTFHVRGYKSWQEWWPF